MTTRNNTDEIDIFATKVAGKSLSIKSFLQQLDDQQAIWYIQLDLTECDLIQISFLKLRLKESKGLSFFWYG